MTSLEEMEKILIQELTAEEQRDLDAGIDEIIAELEGGEHAAVK